MTTEIKAGFGKAKYGRSGDSFVKTGKVVAGEQFIRILPPMHSLADNGTWKVWRATHWGYKGNNPRDASKTISRPFRCILDKDRRSGLVRQECPGCTYLEGLIAKRDEMLAGLKAKGLSKDEIKTAMSSIEQLVKDFNVEKKFYVNVLHKDGSVGDFKLNFKDHMTGILALTEGTPAAPGGLIKDEGIDPIEPDQGVWFKITRNGDGVTPPDSVTVEQKEELIGGRKLRSTLLAPLTDEQCEKALKECRDLDTLGGYVLTYDQILALTQANGDPDEIDRIFGLNKPREQSASSTTAPQSETLPEDPGDKAATLGATEFVVNGKSVTKDQFDRYNTVMAKKKAEAEAAVKAEAVAKAKAAEAAKVKLAETKAPSTPVESGAVDVIEMTDDQFMATLG